ncbi:MAG: alginate lyase family protein [Anaerolineae bacterium]|nr:alginate lyase family protein [Anaerolineae bacterium]
MTGLPRVFCLSPVLLARGRDLAREGDSELRRAVEALRAEAEAALDVAPCSVMDKSETPPSGDKHDYLSYGPYWWPDPAQPDGLPYIRRDGEVNPETRSNRSDRVALSRVTEAVDTLTLAFYITGVAAYAAHAARLLRAWFVAPDTRMNPHLQFGQAIPGRVEGRGTGIIDTGRLSAVVDALGLLDGAPAWGARDQVDMVAWFGAYLEWLRHSDHGRDEDAAGNNHGTWYDVQVASFALLTGDRKLAAQTVHASQRRRIAAQIAPDGRQPRELVRTKTLGYSIMNLTGLFRLAEIGEQLGMDLWTYRTVDGRSLRAAIDFLAPYADPEREWPFPQIDPLERSRLFPLLRRAAIAYGDAAYEEWIAKLPGDAVSAHRAQLLYPRR